MRHRRTATVQRILGFLLAGVRDQSLIPGLRTVAPALVAAPVAFHLSVPQDDWFPAYMLGIAFIVFAPIEWLHAFGRALTRPTRGLAEEEVGQGIDERASRVFYLSLLGLVAALYALSYTAFHALLGLAAGWFAARWWARGRRA